MILKGWLHLKWRGFSFEILTILLSCLCYNNSAKNCFVEMKTNLNILVQMFHFEVETSVCKLPLSCCGLLTFLHNICSLKCVDFIPGMIVTSALIIWKALICITGSESPVVVVLSGSMEPGFKRVSQPNLWMLQHVF